MVFLVLLIPIGVLLFPVAMERIEHRLQSGSMSERDVEEFLDHADPDEVTTFVREGWARALSRFRVRNRSNRPSRRRRSAFAGTGQGSRGAVGGGAESDTRNRE